MPSARPRAVPRPRVTAGNVLAAVAVSTICWLTWTFTLGSEVASKASGAFSRSKEQPRSGTSNQERLRAYSHAAPPTRARTPLL